MALSRQEARRNNVISTLNRSSVLAAVLVALAVAFHASAAAQTPGVRAPLDNSALLPKVRPDTEVEMEGTSPDWVKTLIMAQFRIETATPEGTFAAATKVLDHYAEMGVNGLWINPIYERGSKGNGYENFGPETIEPRLTGSPDIDGSFQVVRQFVAAAHQRNIRIIFDIVVWGTAANAPLVTAHPEFYRHVNGGLWGFSGGKGVNADARRGGKTAGVKVCCFFGSRRQTYLK